MFAFSAVQQQPCSQASECSSTAPAPQCSQGPQSQSSTQQPPTPQSQQPHQSPINQHMQQQVGPYYYHAFLINLFRMLQGP